MTDLVGAVFGVAIGFALGVLGDIVDGLGYVRRLARRVRRMWRDGLAT